MSARQPMSTLPEEQLQAVILDRLAALGTSMGPRLGGAWRRLAARLRLAERDPGYFLHPLAFPVLQLPVWAAEASGGRVPEALVLDACEAAAAGYLHVRIQDDLLDEGVGEGAATLLLSDALLTRHQRLIAQVAGDAPGFWDHFEATWLRYSEAMLLERGLHDGEATYDADGFEAVLDRSRPLSLPPAAVLARAGSGWPEALSDFTSGLAASHQLFTDVIDAERDLAAGNYTWVIQRMGVERGDPEGQGQLRRGLYLQGGLDQIMAEALSALKRAEHAAQTSRFPEACGIYLERRRAMMAAAHVQVFKAFFAQVF